jgi:MFS family permease
MPLARRIARLRSDAALFPRSFWILWWGTLVNRLGMLVLPFLTLYLTREQGLRASEATLFLSGYGAGALISSLVGGDLADRIGRRATILLSLLGGAAAIVAVPFLDAIPALAAAVFAIGLFGEMYRPAVSAAVTDLVPDALRPRAFALLYWVINIGVAVASAVGGFLVERSFVALFVIDGLTMVTFAGFIALGVPESRPDPGTDPADDTEDGARGGSLLRAVTDPALQALTLLPFLVGLCFYQAYTTLPLAMAQVGLSPTAYGIAIAANGVLIALFALPIAHRVEKRPPGLVLAGSAFLVAVGFGLQAPAATLVAFVAAIALWTFGEMAFFPVIPTVVSRLSPLRLRGTYQGVAGLAWGLAGIVAPATGGWVLERFGNEALWLGCSGLALVATGGFLLAHRRFGGRMAVTPTDPS